MKQSRHKRSIKEEKERKKSLPPLEYIEPWKCASCMFMNRNMLINDREFAKWRENCLLCGRIKREYDPLMGLSNKQVTEASLDEKLLKEWNRIKIRNKSSVAPTHKRGGSSSSSNSSLSFTSQTLCGSHYIDCLNIKRLIFIMKYFDNFSARVRNNGKYKDHELTLVDFFEYITDYDVSDLYFDLYHTIQLHWNKFLISLFKVKIHECDIKTCIHFKRNYRDRAQCTNKNYRFKLYLTNDNNDIAIIQILIVFIV